MTSWDVKLIEAETLSPMQYHTVQVERGTRTLAFVGDLALMYAIHKSTGAMDEPPGNRKSANYEELAEYPVIASVLRPKQDQDTHLPVMARNTMLGIEETGTNTNPKYKETSDKVGSKMYKNFYHTQPLKPGVVFTGAIAYPEDEELELPPTVRVGNQRRCLLEINEVDSDSAFNVWGNLYTAEHVLGLDSVKLPTGASIDEVLHQYRIVKDMKPDKLVEWCETAPNIG